MAKRIGVEEKPNGNKSKSSIAVENACTFVRKVEQGRTVQRELTVVDS